MNRENVLNGSGVVTSQQEAMGLFETNFFGALRTVAHRRQDIRRGARPGF